MDGLESNIIWRWYHCSTGDIISNGTTVCGDNVWKHNLYTYDSSGVRSYINGALVDSSLTAPYLNNLSLKYMGIKTSFGTNGLHGYLDDVFSTSAVLDADSVQHIYEQGIQGRSLRWL